MIARLGIRREDKNPWERRAPLTPGDLRRLLGSVPSLSAIVQPSSIRVFPDRAYAEAGAAVREDLDDCAAVIGVKEMPIPFFRPRRLYLFFSHTIKGQRHNMPMLRRIIELGSTLIDYERIVDAAGRRLVFFGRYAGLAGMIDTLWALGQRLLFEGVRTPLAEIKLAHAYPGLAAAREAISAIGRRTIEEGLPPSVAPIVVGFCGYGHVSNGAQEIFDLLPHCTVEPRDLVCASRERRPREPFVKVVFREEHTVRPRGGAAAFDLKDFFARPERYESIFRPYLDHLTVLVNCIFWSPQCPRIVTRADAAELWGTGRSPRLKVIGDISCDIGGGVELTLKATEPGNPVFVYTPSTGAAVDGVAGHGPVVMAVDNLPCELPAEASEAFSRALMPFMPGLVAADPEAPLERAGLPDPLRRAVLVWRGELTPEYTYLGRYLS